MKITIDLPAELVDAIKLRAVRQGRKLKDAAVEVLRAGLAAGKDTQAAEKAAKVAIDKMIVLPVIQCRRAARQGEELTPGRVVQILVAQEAGWARDSR